MFLRVDGNSFRPEDIQSILLFYIESFFQSIIAKIGHDVSTLNPEEQFAGFNKVSFINICINGVAVSCFYWLVQDFICLWLGPDVMLAQPIVILISCNLFLNGMRKATGVYRQSCGIFHRVGEVVIGRGLINLVLSVFMGIRWNIAGVVLATAVSNLVTMYWFEPYLMYRHYNKSLKWEIWFQVSGTGSCLLCMWLSGAASGIFSADTWGGFLVKSVVCGITGVCCYGAIGIAANKLFRQRVKNNT